MARPSSWRGFPAISIGASSSGSCASRTPSVTACSRPPAPPGPASGRRHLDRRAHLHRQVHARPGRDGRDPRAVSAPARPVGGGAQDRLDEPGQGDQGRHRRLGPPCGRRSTSAGSRSSRCSASRRWRCRRLITGSRARLARRQRRPLPPVMLLAIGPEASTCYCTDTVRRRAVHNRCVLSLVDATIGQRSPMATCRMTPAPMKPRAAVVIQSLGVTFVQCTLPA